MDSAVIIFRMMRACIRPAIQAARKMDAATEITGDFGQAMHIRHTIGDYWRLYNVAKMAHNLAREHEANND